LRTAQRVQKGSVVEKKGEKDSISGRPEKSTDTGIGPSKVRDPSGPTVRGPSYVTKIKGTEVLMKTPEKRKRNVLNSCAKQRESTQTGRGRFFKNEGKQADAKGAKWWAK